MFKLFSVLAVLLFVLFGIVIGLMNPVSVELNLFVSTLTLPLSVIMSALLVIGMLIGGGIVFVQVLRLRWRLRSKVKECQKLSDQIVQLKKENVEVKEKQAQNKLTNESNSLVSLENK